MYGSKEKQFCMKTIRLALALSFVALVTTACFRLEVAFTVNDDGSGTVRHQIAVKDALIGLGGEDINFAEELGDLPPGAEVQDYSEDGYTGVVVTIPIADFSDMGEVEKALGGLDESSDLETGLSDDLSINRDEDGAWQFSMLIPSSEESSEAMMDFEGMEALFDDAWFRVRIKLPGELAEHNADRIEGGELVWELDFTATEERQLTARSIPGGGLPIVPIVAGVAGIVVLAAFVWLAYARRRR